jgi:hypothetical protein
VNFDAKPQRSSTYSSSLGSRSSIQIDPQIDPQLPHQSQRSSTYSQLSSSSRNSTNIQTENPPILLVRRSTSPTPERRSRLDAEKERRRSHRVSFVYQESDINAGEGEGMYPAPLQRQWQMRAGEEGRGRDDGEEIKDYEVSFEGGGLFAERKERRKSIWRQSVGMGMSMSRAGVGLGGTEEEEEILYSGSEYEGGGDSEIDIRPVVDRDGGDVERDEMKGRRQSVRMLPHADIGLGDAEEEILYSGSDYDGEPEDSDDEILPPAARDRDRDGEKGKGKTMGEGEDRGRGSVLFEMLYAHASQPQPQFQFQSQAATETGLEERRERRMSIKPLALGGKKGVGGTREGEGEGKEGMGMGIGTDSEYETEYVDTD